MLRRLFGSVWADALLAVALLGLGEYEVWTSVRYDDGLVFPGPQVANGVGDRLGVGEMVNVGVRVGVFVFVVVKVAVGVPHCPGV